MKCRNGAGAACSHHQAGITAEAMLISCCVIYCRGMFPPGKEGKLGDEHKEQINLRKVTLGGHDLRRILIWGFVIKLQEALADACGIQ